MSWAKDEWKDGLNANVLGHITELEQQNERIVKDHKQKQFQLDSINAAFEKQKRFTEEEKGKHASLKREIQSLSESRDETEKNKQKLLHELQLKDGKLSCIEGHLNRLKQTLDNETNKATQLKIDLEKVQYDQTQSLVKYEKQSTELSKLQEHNSFQRKQLEGHTEKIKSLEFQLRQSGDYSSRSFSSRSSSQSSNSEAQNVNDVLVSQQESEKLVDEKSLNNDAIPEIPETEVRKSSHMEQQLVELNNSMAKLELQLQASQKELMNKKEELKQNDVELAEVKQNFDNKMNESAKVSEELMKTTSQFDKIMIQLEATENKSKHLGQELECQRHNSEAVIKGHEERLKEKEKQYREELSSKIQALTTLDKQHQELTNKMQHEQNTAQATQRELQGKLDHIIQETQRLKQQIADAKSDESNNTHAMKAKDQTITELGQEINSLKQEKNAMLAELDREAGNKKKLEDQLNATKNEVTRKEDVMKNADNKAMGQVAELEKTRKQALCDLENSTTVRTKLDTENKELKKQLEEASCSTGKKEHEMMELKQKVELYETNIERLNQEVHQLKSTVNENEERNSRLEEKLKEVEQLANAKDNDARNMATQLDELEKKGGALVHELENKKYECNETKTKNCELLRKQENSDKILEGKTSEVNDMRKSVTEFEDLQIKNNSDKENKVVELEKYLMEEKRKYTRLQEERDEANKKLEEQKRTEDELRTKLEDSSLVLLEQQVYVTKKDKELEEQKKIFKNQLAVLEDNIALVRKENELEKQEVSKAIKHKNEELFGTLDELEKKSHDVVKLREAHINLQNMLTAHVQEKVKTEESFREQCKNTLKKEEELLAKCEELELEKTSFSEKEKHLNIANEAFKRDIKALQNDYKKVCELSDSKSSEFQELVDTYEASTKEFEHWRQRAVKAETSLKEYEQRLKDIHEEKDIYITELAAKEEQIEFTKKELCAISSEKQALISIADERCGILAEKLDKESVKKNQEEIQGQRMAMKISELQTALENSDTSFITLKEAYENKDRVIEKKEWEIEELAGQLKTAETTLSKIQKELNEKNKSNLEQKYQQLDLQNEEQREIIKVKEQEINLHIKDFEKLRNRSEEEIDNLRQKMYDLEKQMSDLLEKKTHLEIALESKDTAVSSVRNECREEKESLSEAHQVIQSKEQDISNITTVKNGLEVKLKDVIDALRVKEQDEERKDEELVKLQSTLDSKLQYINSKSLSDNGESETLRSQLQQMQQWLEISKTNFTKAQEELQAKNAEQQQAQTSCQNLKDKYEELKKKEEDFLEQSQNLNAALETKARELDLSKEEIEKLQSNCGSDATCYQVKESQWNAKIAELSDELQRVGKSLMIKEEELKEALDKADSMELECEAIQSMMDDSAEMTITLQDQNTVLSQKQQQLTACLEQKNKELETLQEKRDTLELKYQSSSEQLSSDLDRMKQEVDNLKQKLSAAFEIEELRLKEMASLKDELTNKQNNKCKLATKLKMLQDSFASLEEEKTNLVQKVQHTSEVVMNKESDISVIKSELDGIKATLDMTSQKSLFEITELRNKNEVLEAQVRDHEELINIKVQKLNQLSSKYEELQKESDELRAEIENKITTSDKTKEELDALASKNEILTNLIENQNQEINCKSEENEKNVGEMETEIQRQRDLLANTSKDLDAALSEKEKVCHLLEVKEKELLKLTQINEENMLGKEEIRQILSAFKNNLQIKTEKSNCLEEQKAHLEGMVETLNSESQVLLQEKKSIKEEAENKVEMLKVQLQENTAMITQLTEEKDKLEERVQLRENELQKFRDQSAKLEKDLDGLTAQKEILQMDFEDKDELIKSYKIQINQLQGLIKETKQKYREKEDRSGAESKDMEALISQLQVTQMDVEDKEGYIEELTSKVIALESQVKNLKDSINPLKESLDNTQMALEHTSMSLNETTKEVELVKYESGASQEKSGELVENLQKTVEEIKKEKNEFQERVAEKERLAESLCEDISLLKVQLKTLLMQKEDMQITFSTTIASLKQSKQLAEKQLEDEEKQLKMTAQIVENQKEELNAIKAGIATERSNLLNSNQEITTQIESKEKEMTQVLKKLLETEEALGKTRNELSKAIEEKDLSQNMLVAVDGNLQTFKTLVIEKEHRVKELEALLADNEDKVTKLKELSTEQEEELGMLKNGINENSLSNGAVVKEWEAKMQELQESSKLEIKNLNEEFNMQVRDLQKRQQLFMENASQQKFLQTEMENNISNYKQEIVELNQVIGANSAELEAKTLEIEIVRIECDKLQSSRENIEQDFNTKIQDLKEDMQAKEEDIKHLEEKVINLAMESEVQNEDSVISLSAAKQENEELQKRVQSLSSSMETAEEEVRKSCTRMEELESMLQETKYLHFADYSKLQDKLKEVEVNKAEIERKIQQDKDQVLNVLKKTEKELRDALSYEKEQNANLQEDCDKLRDRLSSLTQSIEDLQKEHQGKTLQLNVQLEESKQSLKLSCNRVEELLKEKRVQYDAMVLAERESNQARNELEKEIASSKQRAKLLKEELDETKQNLNRMENEINVQGGKYNDMQTDYEAMKQNFNECESKYRDEIADISMLLETTKSELRKIVIEKDEVTSMFERCKIKLEQTVTWMTCVEKEKENTDVLRKEAQALNGTIELLQKQLTALEADKSVLLGKLEEERPNVSALKARYKTLEQDIVFDRSKWEVDSSQLKQTIEELELKNSELNENIFTSSEHSEDKLRTFNQKIDKLTNENEELGKKFDEKCTYAKQLEDSNDELLEVNEKLCQKIETLEDRLQQKMDEITSLRGQTSSVNQDYEDALHELETLRQESSEAIDKREEKISSLTHRLEDIQKSLDEMSLEKKHFLREKEDLLDQITSAKRIKEEALKDAEENRLGRQDKSVAIDDKNHQIIELTNHTNTLQQTIEAKQREFDEIKAFLDSSNEDLDELCEQRAEEIEKLKQEAKIMREEMQDLERKLREKEEEFGGLSQKLLEKTSKLDRLAQEHESCKDFEPRIEKMRQYIDQAEYALSQEKNNSVILLKSFEERELQWEEEKEKLVSVEMKFQNEELETNVRLQLAHAEDEIKQLESTLSSKDDELISLQRTTEKNATATEDQVSQLKSKMTGLEQRHEELKYQLKQKQEELFVLDNKLKEKEQQIENIEKKLTCSEEIELELRHHLGDVTQQLEKLREACMDVNTSDDEIQNIRTELNEALEQICGLKQEVEKKDAQLDEEKSHIVEAAKEFAVRREEEFEQKLASKEEQITTVENELNQLKHQLQLAQESQKALLEAADEREREYEQTKNKLQDGSLNHDKFVQLSLKLNSEKQKVQQLEENCKILQEVIDARQLTMSTLRKQLNSLNKDHSDEQIRLESEITSLNQEIQSIQADFKAARESLSKESARVKELAIRNESLQQALQEYRKEAQKERVYSTDTEEECKVLKEQLNEMMSAKSEADLEKEELIVSESKEKFKLRETERQLEKVNAIKTELQEKATKIASELCGKLEYLDVVNKEKMKLHEQVESLEKQCEKDKIQNEELTKLFKELEAIYYRKEQELAEANIKLKNIQEELSTLNKDHEEEVEFSKVQLLLAEEKCSNLRQQIEEAHSDSNKQEKSHEDWTTEVLKLTRRVQELEACYNKSKGTVAKFDGELCSIRYNVTELEEENKSLKLRLKTKRGSEPLVETSREVQERIKQLEESLSKQKSRADEEENKFNTTVDEYHAFIMKYRILERQNTSLQRRLQFANEKLIKKSDKTSEEGSDAQTQPSSEVLSPKLKATATVTSIEAANLLSPLARSMSSLGIASSTVTTASTTDEQQPVRSLIPPPRAVAHESVLSVRAEQQSHPVRKLTKRTAERDTLRVSKRHRLTSQGDSVPVTSTHHNPSTAKCESPECEPPEGLPEVVSKGFNDIPDIPMKSPFILRRTTAQIPKTRLDKPSLGKQVIKTRSQLARGAQKTNIPTMNRATMKENPSSLRSPPRAARLAGPYAVLSPRKTNIPKPSDGPSPKKTHLSSKTRPSRRSMGKHAATRSSSLKQPIKIKPLEGSPAKPSKDEPETCPMQ